MILFFCVFALPSRADVCDPYDIEFDEHACADPDDPNLPLDGGVSFLLATGTLYAIKKIKENRSQKRDLAAE